MSDTPNDVRVVFYGRDEFMTATENIQMDDELLIGYIKLVADGGLSKDVRRVSLFTKDRPFRRIMIDMQ